MTEQSPLDHDQAARLLAEIDSSSAQMLETQRSPRWLLVLVAAVIASMLSFRQLLGLPVFLLLLVGLVPTALWYALSAKRRGKLRTLKFADQGTGLYVVVPFLLTIVTDWVELRAFWPILACWLATFSIGWACLEQVTLLERRARIKDAHERAH